MKFHLDRYAHLDSPIHRWKPESKLIGLGALTIAFASVEHLTLVPVMLVLSATIYWMSNLPRSFWQTQLRYPGLFIGGLVCLLPFMSGKTVIWQLAFLTVRQEGTFAMLLIASRFIAIMTLCLVLFGTCSFLNMIKAMRSLGLSSILADMTLLSYRYIFELGQQLTMMRTAMRLRGFQPHQLTRRTLQTFASLAGTLFVRSYEQSEQVYNAMRLRGYGHGDRRFCIEQNNWFHKLFPDRVSTIALFLCILLAATLIVAEIFL